MSTRIILVDHHVVFREAVRGLIDAQSQLSVVGEASDGREAYALCRELQPDLVVTEISIPRLSGVELAVRLARELPRTRVLILSGHESRSQVTQALRSGAAGYVCKSGPAQELIQAIDAVRSGRSFVSPVVAEHLVGALTGPRETDSHANHDLTSREREVLQMVAEGLSSKEIATELGVSTRTVESHRTNVMEKLGIHKVSGLVRFAIREGLLNA